LNAVLEGVGYGVRHNLQTFAAIGARVERVVAVGGGTQTDTWLQIVSDICGVPQIVPAVTVGASFGDAFLAGCAAGLLKREDISRLGKETAERFCLLRTLPVSDAKNLPPLALQKCRRAVAVSWRIGQRSRPGQAVVSWPTMVMKLCWTQPVNRRRHPRPNSLPVRRRLST
jgi:hypothetical protein